MNFERIDKTHLKVELEEFDLDGLEINYDSFNYDNEHSRTIIRAILQRAYEETGFLYTDCRLIVEVFKTKRGCIILFSTKTKARRLRLVAQKMYIYKFNSFNALIDCINSDKTNEISEKCRVYAVGNVFYVCVNSKINSSILLHMNEFSSLSSVRREAMLKEYGRLIKI